MAPSLFLLIAVVLAFAGGAAPWVLVATVLVAAAAGTRLPDLDTPLGLNHRSALLHGILPVLIPLLDRRTWGVAAGLGLGIGLHLAADLFPGRMRGYATIKLPLIGSMGALLSYVWIVANTAACVIGGAMILTGIADRPQVLGVVGGMAVLGIAYLLRTSGGWWVLGVCAGVVWWMR